MLGPDRSRSTFLRWTVAALAIAVLALGACGGDDDGASEDGERPVTSEEAGRLASTLFNNFDTGGATFELTARFGDGSTATLAGEMDWTDHLGHADVRGDGPVAGLTEVFWTDPEVLERRPALDSDLAKLRTPAPLYVSRPVNPADNRLDSLLAVVVGLAAEQRENPLLVQQSGATWLRVDEVRGTAVDVIRSGENTVFWIDQTNGDLLRFESTPPNGTTMVVNILDRGTPEIRGPRTSEVASIVEIQAQYDAVVG